MQFVKIVFKGSFLIEKRFGRELLTVKPGSIPDPDQENMKHFRQFRDIRSDEKRVSRRSVLKLLKKFGFDQYRYIRTETHAKKSHQPFD